MSLAAVMPTLAGGFYGFHHTVGSGLEVLAKLGVSASRITISMCGSGYPSRWIVQQEPRPGTPLNEVDTITLSVAGLGYYHALPVGMWDRGDEREIGTKEIVELLDDPIQKAAHWLRDGSRLFAIDPETPASCREWISLFGLTPEDWPVDTWYDLSVLLPSVQEIAATAHGIRLIFQLLLRLPVKDITYFPTVQVLDEDDCSLLGERAFRLGIDCIVGDRLEDVAGMRIVVGPVSLEEYDACQRGERRALLSRVLDLSVSCHRDCRLSWSVADATRGPRLGIATENARLGINSHLGALAGAV